MRNLFKILIVFIFLVNLFTINFAYAGIHTGPIVPCTDDCTLCDLWHLGSNIINFISFNLAIPVAGALFIVSGVIFLVSGGDENKITLARTIFTNTIIGLFIIMCSWLLVDTLIKTIATSTISGAWNTFPICN
ncbi:MAG: hypothetical protein ISS02_02230 [Candidatus Portnoybacteria bacterium]|nr:hypothetical protein [Candidatus Portnoybacteria bacterium]